MNREETPVVNETTGGRKNTKLARFDLIPPNSLVELAEHFGRGAQKYPARNWELGVPWSSNFAAMQRHLWLWWGGEEGDDGGPHLAAAMWHACVLLEYATTHPELDDRPGDGSVVTATEPTDASLPADVAEEVMARIELNKSAWRMTHHDGDTSYHSAREDLPA